jgi:nicotinamidase-related amidase
MYTEEVQKAIPQDGGNTNVVIVGLEAHVCVQQTTLDLIEKGYSVHLCVDAISSQKLVDRAAGLHRADRAGAFVTTTESVMMELIRSKDHEQFKPISGLLKNLKVEDGLTFP